MRFGRGEILSKYLGNSSISATFTVSSSDLRIAEDARLSRTNATKTWFEVFLCLAALVILSTQAVSANGLAFFLKDLRIKPSVQEMPLDMKQAGRINSIALNGRQMMVATETGGFFRSSDAGKSWEHMDGLPVKGSTVKYVPGTVATVIATGVGEWGQAEPAGIWRSTDGGNTWNRPPLNPPPGTFPGCREITQAFEVDVSPTSGHVYVATTCGVVRSSDQGVSWTLSSRGDGGVYALAALGNERLIAAGPGGLYSSIDDGINWTQNTSLGGIYSIHALGSNPKAPLEAFLQIDGNALYVTRDAGQSWTPIPKAPKRGDRFCGGITFERAISTATGITLYSGDKCWFASLEAPASGTTFDYNGDWKRHDNLEHGDTRDIAFDTSGTPQFLATDGGLLKPVANDAWKYFVGPREGLNALQITEITGTASSSRDDLYFGTQDNRFWASDDGGQSWPYTVGVEGGYLGVERNPATNPLFTFADFGGGGNFLSPLIPLNPIAWKNPPGNTGSPLLIANNTYVQTVNSKGGFEPGLVITTDAGNTWRQLVIFSQDTWGLPKIAGPSNNPMLYVTIKTGLVSSTGSYEMKLARVANVLNGFSYVTFPAMRNFGGMGQTKTEFAVYYVLITDPVNPNHLIAPDIVNESVKESFDGGDSWKVMPALTKLVTDAGGFKFQIPFEVVNFPQLSAGSACPENADRIVIGTQRSGVFLSQNGGRDWTEVPGGRHAVPATSVFWPNCDEAIISTYGRGLWKLTGGRYIKIYVDLCRDCFGPKGWRKLENFPPRDKPDWGFVVAKGRITGMTVKGNGVTDITVLPGSQLIGLENTRYQQKLKIREAASGTIRGIKQLKDLEGKRLGIMGITFKGNEFAGVLVSNTKVKLLDRPTKPVAPVTQDIKSLAIDKPYLRLECKQWNAGLCLLKPNETFSISGEGFNLASGEFIELRVDNVAIARVDAFQEGRFQQVTQLPELAQGSHVISAIKLALNAEEKLLDVVGFSIPHEDEAER